MARDGWWFGREGGHRDGVGNLQARRLRYGVFHGDKSDITGFFDGFAVLYQRARACKSECG